ALTLDSDEDIMEKFISGLHEVFITFPKEVMTILLEVKVGHDPDVCGEITGEKGMGEAKANGVLLLTKCA
ncbi:hypothetical protein scyTo_0025507, partial [Scyliorhinus torazame]|nr:hypothetical protein [Scyliorhinus torazame]